MDKPEPKKTLREKVVLLYDQILKGEEPYGRNPSFWQDFYLLWPNTTYLEKELSTNDRNLVELKPIIHTWVFNGIHILEDDEGIRAVNCLQTLSIMFRSLTRRTKFTMDVIELLFGVDRAEELMQMLIDRVCHFISGQFAPILKTLSLRWLLSLTTSVDNINENTLFEYFLMNSVFESVIQLLSTPVESAVHGRDALLLLTLLANYRKYDNCNQYIAKLSILDHELALNGYSRTVAGVLSVQNKWFHDNAESNKKTGFLTSVTNLVGSWLVDEDTAMESVQPDLAMLLALYEAVHLNRNFIAALTTAPTETNGAAVTSDGMDPRSQGSNRHPNVELADITCSTNLLTSFLTYTSIMQQHLKSERCYNAARLCAVILTCISEDQYANTLMHDMNMMFKVPIFRAPMRHRKGSFDKSVLSRPLACTVLDLCVEFILSHMMRNLPFDLYMRFLGVIQRILCFEKKCRVRLDYPWRTLWNALVCLLKFLVAQESHLLQTDVDIFALAHKAVVVLNLFITYGDTFLPNPSSYDELYYEIIRNSDSFGSLYSLLLRHGSSDGPHKIAATKLATSLVNVRAILSHFQPKIEALHTSSLTEQEILEIVRNHYDSLILKLQENLDSYDRYDEQPQESSFLIQTLKTIVADSRQYLQKVTLEHQAVLNELSTIK